MKSFMITQIKIVLHLLLESNLYKKCGFNLLYYSSFAEVELTE